MVPHDLIQAKQTGLGDDAELALAQNWLQLQVDFVRWR